MAPIRVLMWLPGTSPFGGHRVQMEMTAAFLARHRDVVVHVSHEERPTMDDLDLVHGFALEPHHVRVARAKGLPVCLSPIYCGKHYRLESVRYGGRRGAVKYRVRMTAVLALAAARGRHLAKAEELTAPVTRVRALYESVDLLLPNSSLEAEAIARELDVTTPMRIVPNGVDPALFSLPAGDRGSREGVIYVGRIEPHKNQLRLIEALRGLDVSVTLVGPDHPHHAEYCRRVRRAGGRNVHILGPVRHSELDELYSRAQVHALPSLFETTGLVSLEAALCGCRIVTTRAGFAREYFGDDAWYCDPYDTADIHSAILAALSAPTPEALRERILGRYTWEHTASATLAAYAVLLHPSRIRSAPDPEDLIGARDTPP